MSPEQQLYRDAWLAEMWAPVRELGRGQRAQQRGQRGQRAQQRGEAPTPAEPTRKEVA